jgi:microcystin-dependent protein
MSDPYIGEIRMFGGNFAPVGWLLCQGQLLPIDQYDALFNLIGTTYGGDGQQTFAMPDLQSRLPVHVGSNYVLGQVGGSETVTLTTPQLPIHTHQQLASSGPAASPTPTGRVPASWADGQYSTAPADSTLAPNALTIAGGSQPHENMSPYLCLNFIIATEGIYPPPN